MYHYKPRDSSVFFHFMEFFLYNILSLLGHCSYASVIFVFPGFLSDSKHQREAVCCHGPERGFPTATAGAAACLHHGEGQGGECEFRVLPVCVFAAVETMVEPAAIQHSDM